jgi:1-acyl-sn-glycerol-3-phosphate acyltransferase
MLKDRFWNLVCGCGRVCHASFFLLSGILFMVWVVVCTFFNGNLLPLMSVLFIRPISLSAHEYLLCYIASLGWSTVLNYCVFFGRFQPVFYGDLEAILEAHKGNKLLLSNHVGMTDGLALFAIAQRAGRLGQLRFFAKKSLLFFPVLGFGCYFLNFVFLSRNWLKDSKTIQKTFSDIKKWQRFWMCLFAEGTRITARKLLASQEFARERKMRPLQHVLQPRIKGLRAALEALHSEVHYLLRPRCISSWCAVSIETNVPRNHVAILHSISPITTTAKRADQARASSLAGVSRLLPMPIAARAPSAPTHSRPPRQMDGVLDVTIGYANRDLAAGRAEPSLGNLLLRRPSRPQPLHVAVRLIPAPAVDAEAVGEWAAAVFEEKVRGGWGGECFLFSRLWWRR